MNMEGRITIELQRGSDGYARPDIRSNRPVHASNVFHGKSVEQSISTIPLLFSVCGTAHSCAAVRGCEQAMGIDTKPLLDKVRERLVEMETIREHLWRALLEWSEIMKIPPDRGSIARIISLQRQYQTAIGSGISPFQIGSDIPKPNYDQLHSIQREYLSILSQSLFGGSVRDWLGIENIPMMKQWLEDVDTTTARLLRSIASSDWSSAGRCAIEPLPEMRVDELDRKLMDLGYIEQPLWHGDPCETTSRTRTSSPLLDALHSEYGNGLLVRILSRITELAQLVVKMDRLEFPANPTKPPPSPSPQSGIGRSEAARGLLIHRVEVNGHTVVRYQILAPTEWNFHPQGVVARALGTLHMDSPDLQTVAEMIINAIDPCVGYDLTINTLAATNQK